MIEEERRVKTLEEMGSKRGGVGIFGKFAPSRSPNPSSGRWANVIVGGIGMVSAYYSSSFSSLSLSSPSSFSSSSSSSSSSSFLNNDATAIGKPINLFSAINQALHIALDSDPRFV
ncbi:BCDH BETA1: 2-oxoisovalerate dehydrogenase subunit beta 1 mitochondrial [Bienertia sinuspersici]